jgi:hypothetical protein
MDPVTIHKGKIKITEAFFEPLPEDELKRWEGR